MTVGSKPNTAVTVGHPVLDSLFGDPAVSEVMVNAGQVWIERRGELVDVGVWLGRDATLRLVDRLVGMGRSRVDRAAPLADFRLADGSRVNVVVPPVAPDGPCITVRRFVLAVSEVEDFCSAPVAAVLRAAVRRRINVVVVGPTGAGKTTLLNALAGCVPANERIVTIEDVAELAIDHPHVVRLERRQANADGVGAVSIRQLVVNALRMRPDRIVVGEVRGEEVLDMAQAMNTGHAGSLSTCHANSPRDALRRLEAMALLGGPNLSVDFVRSQLGGAVGMFVQVARGEGGSRRITAVVEVDPRADWSTGAGLRPVTPCAR